MKMNFGHTMQLRRQKKSYRLTMSAIIISSEKTVLSMKHIIFEEWTH